MTPAEFVYSIWSAHEAGPGWGELWAKDHRTGKTYARGWIPWPATVAEIDEALAAIPDTYDRYVTTPIFKERKRDYKNAWPTRWVWLDVDNGYTGDYPPSVKLQTGYKTTQAYWYLKEPIPVPEAVAIGKRLQKRTGADPEGSWICKPLRIPGYLNGKEEYRAAPPPVKLIYFDMKRGVSSLPVEDESIDETHRYPEFVADTWSEPSDADRSVAAFRVYGALKRSDFTKEQIKEVVQLIPWIREKWPDPRYISLDVDRFFSKGPTAEKKQTRTGEVNYEPPEPAFGLGGAILRGTEKPYLVEGWLREGSWQIFHGNPKTFKSAITHHLVVSVASGVPAFGKFAVKRQGPVLILDWENTTQTYQETMWKLAIKKCPERFPVMREDGVVMIDAGSSLPVYIYNRMYQLGDEDHHPHILKAISDIRPALIVIDTLTSCAPGLDVNDILAWQKLQPFLESMCAWRASLLILHHNKKATKDVSTRGHMMSGTHKLYSWAEGLLSTDRGDEDNFVDVHFSGRFQSEEPLRLTVNEQKDEDGKSMCFNDFIVETLTEASETKERERAEKDQEQFQMIKKVLTQLKVPSTPTAVLQQLKRNGNPVISKKVLKAIMDRMVDEGILDTGKSAQGIVYTLIQDAASG